MKILEQLHANSTSIKAARLQAGIPLLACVTKLHAKCVRMYPPEEGLCVKKECDRLWGLD